MVAYSRFQILEKVRSAGKDCILGYGSIERLNHVPCTVEKMIEGPFMRGDFSLADIAAAPFFQVRAERRVLRITCKSDTYIVKLPHTKVNLRGELIRTKRKSADSLST